MYSNRQSVDFVGDEGDVQKHFRAGIEPANPDGVARLTGRSRCIPNWQSPCLKMPNEGLPRDAIKHYGRPYQRMESLTVDWPRCL